MLRRYFIVNLGLSLASWGLMMAVAPSANGVVGAAYAVANDFAADSVLLSPLVFRTLHLR